MHLIPCVSSSSFFFPHHHLPYSSHTLIFFFLDVFLPRGPCVGPCTISLSAAGSGCPQSWVRLVSLPVAGLHVLPLPSTAAAPGDKSRGASAEWALLGGCAKDEMSGGVWCLLASGPLIWRQPRGPCSSAMQMSGALHLIPLPSLSAPCFSFLGRAPDPVGRVSWLLPEVAALPESFPYASPKLLHRSPTKLKVELHSPWDPILGLNAFFPRDQQQTSEVGEEKELTRKNPEPVRHPFFQPYLQGKGCK